jgi:hypothetical protein
MILSHRWRFIFIKGRKVAGTSVEMALSTICGTNDVVTPIAPRDEAARLRAGGLCRNYAQDPAEELPYRAAIARFVKEGGDRFDTLPQSLIGGLFRWIITERNGFITEPSVFPGLRYFNHMSLRDVLRRHDGDLSGYQVFCIERSPYSKALSSANMWATFASYSSGGAMRADRQQLTRALDLMIENGSISVVRNIDLYRGLDGSVAARVLRYTELPGALHAFLAELGAPPPVLPHAKKGLMADTLDPRALLRPDQIAKLNELFREEFQAFGYPMLEP